MSRLRFVLPGIAMLAIAPVAGCGNLASKDRQDVITLPSALNEVSGLAVAGSDSVFTHDDEHAIIYEVRLGDGRILRAFALGDPTLEGDFEGIATADGKVYLVTSDGLIYEAAPGRNGERVPYRVYDSGIGARCEIEGLSRTPGAQGLLILCKRARTQYKTSRLEIYHWPIGKDQADMAPWLSFPLESLLDKDERAEFRPSALEWDARGKRLIVVSARNRIMMTFDAQGHFKKLDHLDKKRHPKAEGLTIMPDGRMVLADEGSKSREGRITSYVMP